MLQNWLSYLRVLKNKTTTKNAVQNRTTCSVFKLINLQPFLFHKKCWHIFVTFISPSIGQTESSHLKLKGYNSHTDIRYHSKPQSIKKISGACYDNCSKWAPSHVIQESTLPITACLIRSNIVFFISSHCLVEFNSSCRKSFRREWDKHSKTQFGSIKQYLFDISDKEHCKRHI